MPLYNPQPVFFFRWLPPPIVSLYLCPYRCVAPHVCAACANRNLLIDLPGLLAKLVLLLRSTAPPRRLWPAQHYYLPNGHVVAADARDDDWASFARRGQVSETEKNTTQCGVLGWVPVLGFFVLFCVWVMSCRLFYFIFK